MYFSDEINLIKEIKTKNELNQYKSTYERKAVFSEIKGISSSELAYAGASGHKAEAVAVVNADDYEGEELVELIEPNKIIRLGIYEVYRKYQKNDLIELYLKEKVGL